MRYSRTRCGQCLGCALTLLFVLAGPLRAEPVIVGVERLSYMPYYNGSGTSFEGFARDLLDAFAADTGREFDYRPLPIVRLMHDFVAGEIDLKFPDNENWAPAIKGDADIVYSTAVAGFITGVSVPSDRLGKGELRNVAIPRGFTAVLLRPRVERGTLELTEVNDLDQGVRMALARRVDGVYGNVLVVQWHLTHQMQQASALLFDATLPYTREDYKLSSIKHPQLIREFDAWLQTHASTVALLKARWQVTE